MATTEYDIDQADFRAWLQAHADQTFRQTRMSQCALSVYLTERLGELVHVSCTADQDYFYFNGGAEFTLPAWVAPINRAAQGSFEDDQIPTDWTGAQLLKLMPEVVNA